jgi:hypothetical protein
MKESEQGGTSALSQLQTWFQLVVTNPQGVEAGTSAKEAQALMKLRAHELEKIVTRSRSLTAAQRLGIYANAYYSRLLECLGEVYPMLKRTLGESAFDDLGFAYLQEYPSRTYTLNELGRHFPQFLQDTRPSPESLQSATGVHAESDAAWATSWPDFLIDLARLEWGIYEVFDGPGSEGVQPLNGKQLAAIDARLWTQIKLKTTVSLRLLEARFPVNDYYTELRKTEPDEAVAIPRKERSFVALTRRDFVVRRHNLSRTQFELLRALQDNKCIGDALEFAVSNETTDSNQMEVFLERWFTGWTANGFFDAFETPADPIK